MNTESDLPPETDLDTVCKRIWQDVDRTRFGWWTPVLSLTIEEPGRLHAKRCAARLLTQVMAEEQPKNLKPGQAGGPSLSSSSPC